jgi:hypothetical protein
MDNNQRNGYGEYYSTRKYSKSNIEKLIEDLRK